eukprot:COSAG05_NODE_245_length_12989_cov_32.994725_4_plen_331_part_00
MVLRSKELLESAAVAVRYHWHALRHAEPGSIQSRDQQHGHDRKHEPEPEPEAEVGLDMLSTQLLDASDLDSAAASLPPLLHDAAALLAAAAAAAAVADVEEAQDLRVQELLLRRKAAELGRFARHMQPLWQAIGDAAATSTDDDAFSSHASSRSAADPRTESKVSGLEQHAGVWSEVEVPRREVELLEEQEDVNAAEQLRLFLEAHMDDADVAAFAAGVPGRADAERASGQPPDGAAEPPAQPARAPRGGNGHTTADEVPASPASAIPGGTSPTDSDLSEGVEAGTTGSAGIGRRSERNMAALSSAAASELLQFSESVGRQDAVALSYWK